MARFNHPELILRQIGPPTLLGVTVFVVASYCMPFPHWTDGNSSLWLATGVPLAALIRSPRRNWPALLVASIVGNIAASLDSMHETWVLALTRSGTNAFEYGMCAWLVRRQCGSYFDITEPRHLAWMAASASLVSPLKVVINFTLIQSLRFHNVLHLGETLSWAPTAIFGLLVLSLSLLAITSRSAVSEARLDVWGLMLLLVLAGEVALIFGPTAFPAIYVVMPVMMLLGWRHGLLGAGLGALITVTLSVGLTRADLGVVDKFRAAGYSAQLRGSYMELFFIVAILSSLPLAIVRARQRAMDAELTGALAAAELRATQLAASESIARQTEAKALLSAAEARQSQAQALQAKERLRSIIETSADIICTLDEDGCFVEISENCESIWGWPRVALLGRPIFEFMPPDEREGACRSYALRQRGEPKRTVQYHFVSPDGKSVPMSWSATWIDKDRICHCVGRDMTEYNALAEQAQHAQRLESLGQLTGGIAHDFNNLLTVMLGTSELLAEKLNGIADLQALAKMTLSAARRGADLTSRLLSFARRQTLVPKSTNVTELVSGMSSLLRRTLGQQVQIEITASKHLANAVIDASQLESAILNLCINSRDAMPDGGRITISLANARLKKEDFKADEELTPGDYISISVRDTGTGVATEDLPHVFEPFFTTKPVGQGSGLGLSMVFGFARQSHGCTRITSRRGEGTMVQLYLPAAPEDETARDSTTVIVAMIGGQERILLVEDDTMVRDMVGGQLQALGYTVTTAPDGHEALRLINTSDAFDLVITDVMMPGGLNGWQLGQKIRNIRPRMPVLFITGFSEDTPAKNKVALADFHLLRKPFGQRGLNDSIRQALASNPEVV